MTTGMNMVYLYSLAKETFVSLQSLRGKSYAASKSQGANWMTNTVPYFNQLFNCILTDLGPPGLVGWFGGAPTCMHTHMYL